MTTLYPHVNLAEVMGMPMLNDSDGTMGMNIANSTVTVENNDWVLIVDVVMLVRDSCL
jgi:hypothetical protein